MVIIIDIRTFDNATELRPRFAGCATHFAGGFVRRKAHGLQPVGLRKGSSGAGGPLRLHGGLGYNQRQSGTPKTGRPKPGAWNAPLRIEPRHTWCCLASAMTHSPLRIATRASRLALWQANFVAGRIRATVDRDVELVEVSTTGDRDRGQPLSRLGNTGVFTREVQRAVLDGRADVAVHSLKDLPTESADGLTLAAVPKRDSVFDALVLPASIRGETDATAGNPLDVLPTEATVGTGSQRRRAQLLYARPDLRIKDVRGNVETRIRKLDDGGFDALILAEAGLRRLELEDRISARLGPPLLYPAVGQGALGIECRAEDAATLEILAAVDDAPTHARVNAERRLLAELRAGCHAPVGVETAVQNGELRLTAVVLNVAGTERLMADVSGNINTPETIGTQAAEHLLQQGADRLMGHIDEPR